jgi:uncharacterized membrane protein YfcA
MIDAAAVASGLAVGLIVGLTGVGGGSLMTPLLMGVFKLEPAIAIGTDLWFAALTKTSGAVAHARHQQVDWRLTRQLLWGSIPAALLTLLAMRATGLTKAWASTLTITLGIALLATALAVALKPKWSEFGLRLEKHIDERQRVMLTVASGALLGLCVTLSSVGAGALGVTMMLLLHPRLPTRTLVGTDIAHAVPLTLVAGTGHALMGHVEWLLLVSLLMGSVPGIWIGAQLTRRLPEGLIRGLLCCSLVTASVKVLG